MLVIHYSKDIAERTESLSQAALEQKKESREYQLVYEVSSN